LLVPGVLAMVTGFALLAALLSDALLETVSLALLSAVVALVVFRLVVRKT
jgi:hypothetical protein